MVIEESLRKKLEEHINYFPRREQAILLCLHEIQNHYGYVPREVLPELSKLLGVPLNRVEGVLAFYDMFDDKEPARHRIRVCTSIVCHFLEKDKLLKALERILGVRLGERTKDGRFKLIGVQCIGACSEAPVFMIDEDTYRFEGEEKLKEILSKYL